MSTEFFICAGVTPGLLVRLERTRSRWRQADLAEAAGVTQAEVSAVERDLYVIPGVVRRVFSALELDVGEGRAKNDRP